MSCVIKDADRQAAEIARLKAELASAQGLLQLTDKLDGERAAAISRLEAEKADLMLQLGRAEKERSMATSLAAGAITINTPSGDPELRAWAGAVLAKVDALEARVLGANRGLRRRLDLLEQMPHRELDSAVYKAVLGDDAPPPAAATVQRLLSELEKLGLTWVNANCPGCGTYQDVGNDHHHDSCSWAIAVKAGRSYLAQPAVVDPQPDQLNEILALLEQAEMARSDNGPLDEASHWELRFSVERYRDDNTGDWGNERLPGVSLYHDDKLRCGWNSAPGDLGRVVLGSLESVLSGEIATEGPSPAEPEATK